MCRPRLCRCIFIFRFFAFSLFRLFILLCLVRLLTCEMHAWVVVVTICWRISWTFCCLGVGRRCCGGTMIVGCRRRVVVQSPLRQAATAHECVRTIALAKGAAAPTVEPQNVNPRITSWDELLRCFLFIDDCTWHRINYAKTLLWYCCVLTTLRVKHALP